MNSGKIRMKGHFPNSLIFVIAAGVIFVAGSYALFGISDATGEPRFLNWVPYERPESKNSFVEKRTLALHTALGDTIIVLDNVAPAAIVNRFLGNVSGGYRTFTFDAVARGTYLEGSVAFSPAIPDSEENVFSAGTVAVGSVQGTGDEKIIILLKESPLPAGYVAIGEIQDEGGAIDAIAALPSREDGLIIDGVPVISATPGMRYEGSGEEVLSEDE